MDLYRFIERQRTERERASNLANKALYAGIGLILIGLSGFLMDAGEKIFGSMAAAGFLAIVSGRTYYRRAERNLNRDFELFIKDRNDYDRYCLLLDYRERRNYR